eukprot:11363442-Alexandrium_andersonii.AAC.1
MALQETRTPTTTQYIIDRFLFVLYGSGEQKEYAGVGFVVDLRIRKSITFTHNCGPRIASMGVRTGPREIILMSAYAPQSGRPLQERSAFYEKLSGQ